jgi:orotidine-5'-phosphate decarboxylase
MTFHPTEPRPGGASRGEGALSRGPRKGFGARLHAAVGDRGPLCVGIDPHAALLQEWGLGDDVHSLERFALTAVEGLAPHVSVIKPQSAFYERFGSRGVAVLERVIAESRAAGALVLLDVKRGDIGSTNQAYADAYLDPTSPLAADAVTVSPYLGFGSLDPLVDSATRHDAGLFVLVLTSNKEGPEVQQAVTRDGSTVAGTMLGHLRRLNADASPLGSFGAVVGATVGSIDEDLAFNGPVLAPGFGAQGGTVDDVRRLFGPAALVLPSSSRGVLRKGPSATAMRDEALRLNDDLRALSRR